MVGCSSIRFVVHVLMCSYRKALCWFRSTFERIAAKAIDLTS